MADLDGDGHLDILSGSGRHGAVVFEGRGDGTFERAVPLRGADGNALELERPAAGVTAVDWDGDGRLDLLINGKRRLLLLPGGELGFGAPRELTTPKGRAEAGTRGTPWVTDWDGDGRRDVVVGSDTGEVWLYRRRAGTPELAEREILLTTTRKHRDTKICVVDWNRDGRVDLALSYVDVQVIPAPGLTASEAAELKRSKAELLRLSEQMTALNESPPDFSREAYAERTRRRAELASQMGKVRAIVTPLEKKQVDEERQSTRLELRLRRR